MTLTVQTFSPQDRARCLEQAARGRLDLLVIGGGINGAGIARDAALRGLEVALVEKADFAWGTSSRSSKLIHGGFRYLQKLELDLVFEACQERALLLDLAPHRVRPLRFLYPTYADHRQPAWLIDLGLTLYDGLAWFKNLERHQRLSAAAVLERQPRLEPQGLTGGNAYHDAVTDDALLTLDTVRGAFEAGALPIPYLEAQELLVEGDRVDGIRGVDRLGGGEVELRARVVVNATGPWTDLTRGRRPAHSGRPMIRASRGAHVALPRHRLPGDEAVVMSRPGEDRILFTIPWGDVVLAGTTDTFHEGDPDEVRATGADVRDILDTLRRYFPAQELGPEDVLGSYAGLRPLIRQEGARASSLSREHQITDEGGLLTVAGGKYTTFRRMAAEVTDRVVARLEGRTDLGKPGACLTAMLPLRRCPGFGAADPEAALNARASGLEPTQVKALRERQPCEWTVILGMIAEDRSLATPAPPLEGPGSGHTQAEILYCVRYQMTLTLADLVCRRLWLHVRRADLGREALVELAACMARELGWSEAEQARQVEGAAAELATASAWRHDP